MSFTVFLNLTPRNFITHKHTREQQVPFIAIFRRKTYQKQTLKQLMNFGNNPMVGATVACAVAVEEASK